MRLNLVNSYFDRIQTTDNPRVIRSILREALKVLMPAEYTAVEEFAKLVTNGKGEFGSKPRWS